LKTQRVHFHDGTFLSFHVVATDDFQLDSYSFLFQFDDGRWIWRKDNSPGHEELGQLEHIHRESERRSPSHSQKSTLRRLLRTNAYRHASEHPQPIGTERPMPPKAPAEAAVVDRAES